MVKGAKQYHDPREWREYPPKDALKRLENYDLYRDLLLGEHQQVFFDKNGKYVHRPEIAKVLDFAAVSSDTESELHVTADYCKMASLIFADILFGKRPIIRAGESDSIQQKRVNQIMIDNTLDSVNHQQAVMASATGDAVFRVRWGKMLNWRQEGAVIEALPPGVYYPILSPGNIKDNKGAAVCFSFTYDDQDYLYRELHEPWQIQYELWRMNGREMEELVPLDTIPAYAHISDVDGAFGNVRRNGNAVIYDTGYPGILVEHIPNWTLPDQFFGISDYSPAVISNQAAINAEMTGILRVVLKHMDPKLILPPGLLEFDSASGKWYVRKEDLDVIEVPENTGRVLPRYVTWDAQLGAAQTNIDRLFESMMLSFQVSPAIFGWNKFGTADSAKALKLRMTLTLWRAAQKRQYFDIALKNILYAAQFLDGRYGPARYDPIDVDITWPDPMPTDALETAQTHQILYVSGLESQETAVKAVQDIDGDALQDELERIRSDAETKALNDALASVIDAGNADGIADNDAEV